MDKKYLQVVGIAFFKDKKLLLSKSHNCKNNNLYTLVGGKIDKGETILEAAVRECKEEISFNFDIKETDFLPILNFKEVAASDPNLIIDMHMLISKKDIDVPLKTSDEIIDYKWYSLNESQDILCASIKNHLIDYAIDHNLL